MKKDKILEWEILVPCKSNKGEEFSITYHKEWDKNIRAISGGLTVFRSAKGEWVHGGIIYSESMIPVRFLSTRKQLDKIMSFTARHYNQIAVKVSLISKEVIIKEYKHG